MLSLSPADLAFAERWSIEDLPACTVGLSFLRQLSETEPRFYIMAKRIGFSDPAGQVHSHSLDLPEINIEQGYGLAL